MSERTDHESTLLPGAAAERFATGGAIRGRLASALIGTDAGVVAAGTRIGAFEIREPIGRGGMGAVYRAERVEGGFEQTVAIKLLQASDPTTRARFGAEMEILARLQHPDIARPVDGGETRDGRLYLAMEYIEGLPIDRHCEQHGLDTAARVRLLLGIAHALAHAHRQLVVHRDIKPQNILVQQDDGRPRLLDFGIAKLLDEHADRALTVPGFGPMTPTYAAPEQFRNQPITVATDVYQFGMLMYRLLGGGLPYDTPTDDPTAWVQAVLNASPLPLARARRRSGNAPTDAGAGVRDRDLDAIVQMALRKEPEHRYTAMQALAADLQAFLDDRPVAARHGGAAYHSARFVSRHRWAVLGAAAAATGLAIATAVAWSQAREARLEATKLQASVELMQRVFSAADPHNGHGGRRELDALLDVAADGVIARFEGMPDLRAQVLLQVADAYASMGLPARAAPLYARAVADLRGSELSPVERAAVLQRGAMALFWNGDVAQARLWIDEAAALATGGDDQQATIRDGLYFTQWLILRTEARPADCLPIAEASVRNAERTSPAVRDDLMQRALVRRGTSHTDLGHFAEGERDLTTAIALASARFGAEHAWTLKARQALGWHYASRGELERGLAILEPAGIAVRRVFGAGSQEWARNLHNRGNIYAALPGRWRDSVAAYRESAEVYRSSSSPRSAIGGLVAAAAILKERHQCAEALPLYLDALQIREATHDLDLPWARGIGAESAACHLELGDLVAARRQIDATLAGYVPTQRHGPGYAAVFATSAAIATAEDQPAVAASALRAAIAAVASDPGQAEARERWQRQLDALAAGTARR